MKIIPYKKKIPFNWFRAFVSMLSAPIYLFGFKLEMILEISFLLVEDLKDLINEYSQKYLCG